MFADYTGPLPCGCHTQPPFTGIFDEEPRLDIKLAGTTVICENASGVKRRIDLKTFRLLRETYRIAKMVRRKRDGLVTRVQLLAEPNEIAKRITGQAEVVRVLPTTYTHRSSLMAGY